MRVHEALAATLASAPQNWERRRFRFTCSLKTVKNIASELPLLSVSAAHGVRFRDEGGLGRQAPAEETIASYWAVSPGDVVINPMWVIEGGVAASQLAGAVSPAYRVYSPAADVDYRFLHHLLRSRPYLEQYRQFVRGTTTFDRSVSKEDFADLPILLPPLREQRRVADFLDAETARIDRLVVAMKSQELVLKQRRLRVLDGTWEIAPYASRVRLGYFSNLVTSGSRGWSEYVSDAGSFFFRSANLHADRILPKLTDRVFVQVPYEAAAEAKRSRIENRDVLIGITGANAGWVCLANEEVTGGHVSQHVCLVRPDASRLDASWLALLISAPAIQEGLMGSQYGGTKTQLSLPDVREIRIPVLPLELQREASRSVTREIESIDRQRQLRLRQISLLNERRQALITAAVTGQFDVSTASDRNVTD
ncbi:hypothetical protein [Streptomyces anulatus]|uniref:hypothetical protein n=1 Tax=Streptomyces anulatus TaxID=1892 RepID=UPI00386E5DBA